VYVLVVNENTCAHVLLLCVCARCVCGCLFVCFVFCQSIERFATQRSGSNTFVLCVVDVSHTKQRLALYLSNLSTSLSLAAPKRDVVNEQLRGADVGKQSSIGMDSMSIKKAVGTLP
jgi:hypothetical protein